MNYCLQTKSKSLYMYICDFAKTKEKLYNVWPT